MGGVPRRPACPACFVWTQVRDVETRVGVQQWEERAVLAPLVPGGNLA